MLARRDVLKGAGALPLAAVLANPDLARAAAGSLEKQTLQTAGGQTVDGWLALPATTPAPALMLIHEWWGLNDQIKAVTAEYAKMGYVALAVDLMKGKVTSNRTAAKAQTQAVQPEEAVDTLMSWNGWLRNHSASTDKLGTVGWCFGGGWSLGASIAAPVDATVIYYGRVTQPADELSALKGPVLGHFATRDKWINRQMIGGFEKEMQAAGKSLEVHWYEADHAFANPTSARYDQEDAKLSWQRTSDFFAKHLA